MVNGDDNKQDDRRYRIVGNDQKERQKESGHQSHGQWRTLPGPQSPRELSSIHWDVPQEEPELSNSVLRVAWSRLGWCARKKSNVVKIWNKWNKISNNDSLRHGVEHADLAGGVFGKHLDWLCAGVKMPCAWRLQAPWQSLFHLKLVEFRTRRERFARGAMADSEIKKLSDSTQEGNNLVSIGVIVVRCICKILFWAALDADGVDGDVVVKEGGFEAGENIRYGDRRLQIPEEYKNTSWMSGRLFIHDTKCYFRSVSSSHSESKYQSQYNFISGHIQPVVLVRSRGLKSPLEAEELGILSFQAVPHLSYLPYNANYYLACRARWKSRDLLDRILRLLSHIQIL